MKRILQITTYDVDTPDHGGKLRSHHIRHALRSTFDVQTLSIEWGSLEEMSGLSVTLDSARMPDLSLNEWLIDLGILTYLDAVPSLNKQIRDAVRSYDPDILLIEQPYLWPVIKGYREDGALRSGTKMIYSSHNVEVDMKRKIYADLFDPESAKRHGDLVDQIEQSVIMDCDLMLCTTPADYAFAGKITQTVPRRIFPNGHTVPKITNRAKAKWTDRFTKSAKNFVFVGSKHPPNVNGIYDFLSALPNGLDPKTAQIWVLGGACDAILNSTDFDPLTNPAVHLTGLVDAEDVEAALSLSSGILLPIWEGSGSNLKTAQALLTDRSIFASEFAFRGFEEHLDEAGVFVNSDPKDIVRDALSAQPDASHTRSDSLSKLTWQEILDELPGFVADHTTGTSETHL